MFVEFGLLIESPYVYFSTKVPCVGLESSNPGGNVTAMALLVDSHPGSTCGITEDINRIRRGSKPCDSDN